MTAVQADSGIFVSGSIGTAELSESFDGFDVDSDSTAFHFAVGYAFNAHFAVEAGYRDFGRFEQTVTADGESIDLSVSANGFTLGVLGRLPVGDRFGLFGRAGSFFWNGNARINALSVASPSDTNFFFGAGLDFRVSDRLAVGVDGSRYDFEDASSSV